jgi:hypothetical protein
MDFSADGTMLTEVHEELHMEIVAPKPEPGKTPAPPKIERRSSSIVVQTWRLADEIVVNKFTGKIEESISPSRGLASLSPDASMVAVAYVAGKSTYLWQIR